MKVMNRGSTPVAVSWLEGLVISIAKLPLVRGLNLMKGSQTQSNRDWKKTW